MGAPSPTARSTPGGIALRDGFGTLITCALDPDISFWEKETQPFGRDGGDMIDTSTFHNTTYRTKAPRALIDISDCTCTAAYDPAVSDQIDAVVNQETTWTVTHPDGSTEAVYAVLRVWTPQSNTDGGQPEAQITISATNTDPSASWAEAGPALASVAGT